MKTKKTTLMLYDVDKMFDFEAFVKNEPDTFDDICKDYPVKEGQQLIQYLKKENRKKRGK